MRIKRFNEIEKSGEISEGIDADILGITTNTGRRTGTRSPNRRTQYFYDYYTGKKISGKSKWIRVHAQFNNYHRNKKRYAL